MSNPIFIELKTGDDESEWNKVLCHKCQLFGEAVFKESIDLMKDTKRIGQLDMGINAHGKKKISAFIFAMVEYPPKGKAMWFESSGIYYRFDGMPGCGSIEAWAIEVLYYKLRGPKNPFSQLVKREFFPTWDEDHPTTPDFELYERDPIESSIGSSYSIADEDWQI